jgi:DNA primase
VDIRAELKRRVDVVPTNSGAMICCPFHDDSNPSLGVEIRRGIFHCFSCGESGTIYKLLAKLDGVSVDEIREHYQEEWKAQRILEELEGQLFDQAFEDAGGSLLYLTRKYKEESFDKAFPLLSVSEEGMAYMGLRGIEDETIKAFDLRWGLVGKYKDRVIIPIRDDQGRLISYTGRSINPDVQPKTRKPKGNKALYTLFGLYQLWKSSCRLEWLSPLILVEGEIDAMYLQQLGIPAVATMGTSSLTNPQVELIIEHGKRVFLLFDGDDAGKKATFSAKGKLSQYLPVYEVELPKGKDPNDLTPGEVYEVIGRLWNADEFKEGN